MDAISRGFGHGPHQRNHRPLAVGAGDRYWQQLVMRIAKTGQKVTRAIQPQINQFRMKRGKPVKSGGGARTVIGAPA